MTMSYHELKIGDSAELSWPKQVSFNKRENLSNPMNVPVAPILVEHFRPVLSVRLTRDSLHSNQASDKPM